MQACVQNYNVKSMLDVKVIKSNVLQKASVHTHLFLLCHSTIDVDVVDTEGGDFFVTCTWSGVFSLFTFKKCFQLVSKQCCDVLYRSWISCGKNIPCQMENTLDLMWTHSQAIFCSHNICSYAIVRYFEEIKWSLSKVVWTPVNHCWIDGFLIKMKF